MKEFISNSQEETEEFAQEFASKLIFGTVIALFGGLGAGKTAFVRGFSKGLGFKGDVSSPTFAIVHEYVGGKMPIYHFDMYRISSFDDLYSTGFFDYMDIDNIIITEWSENIENALPEECIKIRITQSEENTRIIQIEGEPFENISN